MSHETLDGIHRILRVLDDLVLGWLTDKALATVGECHDGRSRPGTIAVDDDLRLVPSMTATQLFVVPKSIPIILPILYSPHLSLPIYIFRCSFELLVKYSRHDQCQFLPWVSRVSLLQDEAPFRQWYNRGSRFQERFLPLNFHPRRQKHFLLIMIVRFALRVHLFQTVVLLQHGEQVGLNHLHALKHLLVIAAFLRGVKTL